MHLNVYFYDVKYTKKDDINLAKNYALLHLKCAII